jgi:hypothetical protein
MPINVFGIKKSASLGGGGVCCRSFFGEVHMFKKPHKC